MVKELDLEAKARVLFSLSYIFAGKGRNLALSKMVAPTLH
jgi:hypothetical protein